MVNANLFLLCASLHNIFFFTGKKTQWIITPFVYSFREGFVLSPVAATLIVICCWRLQHCCLPSFFPALPRKSRYRRLLLPFPNTTTKHEFLIMLQRLQLPAPCFRSSHKAVGTWQYKKRKVNLNDTSCVLRVVRKNGRNWMNEVHVFIPAWSSSTWSWHFPRGRNVSSGTMPWKGIICNKISSWYMKSRSFLTSSVTLGDFYWLCDSRSVTRSLKSFWVWTHCGAGIRRTAFQNWGKIKERGSEYAFFLSLSLFHLLYPLPLSKAPWSRKAVDWITQLLI